MFNRIQLTSGVKVAYREAGEKSSPVILLLHGYPTTSHMFRNLIPLLSDKFHVIAPDLPGFGFTDVPASFEITFANIAKVIGEFVDALKIIRFAMYIFDYGAPTGLRLALDRPDAITCIITQNGNAYEEGLNDTFWKPLKEYWKNEKDDQAFVNNLIDFVEDPKNVTSQYFDGVEDIGRIDPLGYTLDYALITRPGAARTQVSLFYDYKTNVELYPAFQKFFRESSVPVLLVWGKNDWIFPPAGAEAYKRDVTHIRLTYLDTGHFALETHVDEIAREIIDFVLPLSK